MYIILFDHQNSYKVEKASDYNVLFKNHTHINEETDLGSLFNSISN